MKIKSILLSIVTLAIVLAAGDGYSKEGMWIPTLLKKYNIEDMQRAGFKLSAEDVYDINNSSIKDAIVIFGGGCTGEVISDRGLVITNHHCGYGQIQYHSSVENDYLTDGFWAMSQDEELANPGLSVQFLVRMEDVTERVFEGTQELESDMAKSKKQVSNMAAIVKESTKDTHYNAVVKPIFAGNQFFLHIYEKFEDVRLVGAPPSAIGKFGGDTDNWMWPRHTGDFSIFRIYSDKDGNPAKYSPDNIPYVPKRSLKINVGGISDGDFTMVMGYPGSTREYLPSQAIDMIINQSNPDCIGIRTAKLDILAEDMDKDKKVRIQYSSKYARTSNSWKRWIGEIKGLNRLDAIEVKREYESKFKDWVSESSDREQEYGDILGKFETLYPTLAPYQHAYDYMKESISGASDISSIVKLFDSVIDKDTIDTAKLRGDIDLHFKNYNIDTDQRVFVELTKLYIENMDSEYIPETLIGKSSDSDALDKYLNKIYSSSIFSDETECASLVENFNLKKIQKDPIYKLFSQFKDISKSVYPEYFRLVKEISYVQKRYMKAITELESGKALMADANFTMRIAYGKVEGYKPMDGVVYKSYTTLEGIIAKDNPEIYDYNVPQQLKDLYVSKDYGRYAREDGKLPVAFCASNHTTGGNSGSPVLDADGNLIGVNFDRCWEGTMSDLMFDPERCRNIVLDIRYALFLIDKFAGASYLIDEMQLVD